MTTAPDIVAALRATAATADELTPDQTARLLNDAAEVIETLRTLVGIREETDAERELEATPPAGRA